MGFFSFLIRHNINEGVEEFKNTPGAVLLDVRTEEEYLDLLNKLEREGFPPKYDKEQQEQFLFENTWEQRYQLLKSEIDKLEEVVHEYKSDERLWYETGSYQNVSFGEGIRKKS